MKYKKKQPERLFYHAAGGSRTHTVLPPLDFESSASANSATAAYDKALKLRAVEGDRTLACWIHKPVC